MSTSPSRDETVRWVPASASAFGLVGAVVGTMSFSFDGHTVTKGPRVIHAIVDLAHVWAGSIWFGGVVGLVVVGMMRRSSGDSMAPTVLRFSTIAGAALIVVALAGSLMTLMIIDDLGDITGTDWGRLLIVKVVAVGIAAAVGGYNHFVVVPKLAIEQTAAAATRTARVTVAVESVVLIFVVVITAFLTNASPN